MNHKWQAIKLLADADDEVLNAFEERGWQVSFAKGEPVLWEEDACQAVYFITSGAVEVYRTSADGREHTLRVLRAGDSFNLVPALMREGKNLSNVRCLTQTDLLVVDQTDLNLILARYPHFAVHVLQVLAVRLADMTGLVGELALHTVRQRTAAFLMREADDDSIEKGKRWTQGDMARQIGTVRDVIGRVLREFEESGFIRRERSNVSLLNREGLERIANGLE